MGVASLVLGIIALVICWIPVINWLAVILGVVGIVLAAVGKKNGQNTTGGLVCSIIATAISAGAWIACSLCASCAASSVTSSMYMM